MKGVHPCFFLPLINFCEDAKQDPEILMPEFRCVIENQLSERNSVLPE